MSLACRNCSHDAWAHGDATSSPPYHVGWCRGCSECAKTPEPRVYEPQRPSIAQQLEQAARAFCHAMGLDPDEVEVRDGPAPYAVAVQRRRWEWVAREGRRQLAGDLLRERENAHPKADPGPTPEDGERNADAFARGGSDAHDERERHVIPAMLVVVGDEIEAGSERRRVVEVEHVPDLGGGVHAHIRYDGAREAQDLLGAALVAVWR